MSTTGSGNGPHEHRIVIIGSGFGGLGTAIRLKQEGIDDFVVLEKAADVGGTWRENTYPGIACDVPSHLYSFSFAPNPDWSRMFSPGAEIQSYLQRCSRDFGIEPHLRLGHRVTSAAWDDDTRRWHVQTDHGEFVAQIVVAAPGPLHDPTLPDVPGIETFEGAMFHSATWDHDVDLRGKRVAVIGTGASSIQFVPEIQPLVSELHLFQRTAPWVVPRLDHPISQRMRRLYRAFPQAQAAMRGWIYATREAVVMGFMHPWAMALPQKLALSHLERQVADPELRARLTPTYTIGCKRVLISNVWYPAITQPNVNVVSGGLAEVRPHSVVGSDGVEVEVDAIIFGTGFRALNPPISEHLAGRDGSTMAEHWNGSPRAYLGTTVAGFPNLFMLVGPNTGLGHNSIVYMIESQIAYLLDALRVMDAGGVETIEVLPEAEDEFTRHVDEELQGSVWNAGGCASYYLDASGRNSAVWPGFTWRYRAKTRHFDVAHYTLGFRERGRVGVPA